MFTTETFWLGALWGAGVMFVGLWHFLVTPMAKVLGWHKSRAAVPRTATLLWHYEDGTCWAESPEYPEWAVELEDERVAR